MKDGLYYVGIAMVYLGFISLLGLFIYSIYIADIDGYTTFELGYAFIFLALGCLGALIMYSKDDGGLV